MAPLHTGIILAAILGGLPILAFFILPTLIVLAGRTVGVYLRNKTAGRRAHLLELSEAEEEAFAEKRRERRDSDEGWENVEVQAQGGEAKAEEGLNKDWAGIVGFFHPFW